MLQSPGRAVEGVQTLKGSGKGWWPWLQLCLLLGKEHPKESFRPGAGVSAWGAVERPPALPPQAPRAGCRRAVTGYEPRRAGTGALGAKEAPGFVCRRGRKRMDRDWQFEKQNIHVEKHTRRLKGQTSAFHTSGRKMNVTAAGLAPNQAFQSHSFPFLAKPRVSMACAMSSPRRWAAQSRPKSFAAILLRAQTAWGRKTPSMCSSM